TIATSRLPSRLKSPTAIPLCPGLVEVIAGLYVPSPFPSRTEIVVPVWEPATISSLPSPLKSPSATAISEPFIVMSDCTNASVGVEPVTETKARFDVPPPEFTIVIQPEPAVATSAAGTTAVNRLRPIEGVRRDVAFEGALARGKK